MKYGVLVFKDTGNMGDDVQSYASSRFLPSTDYFIEREDLINFVGSKNEPISCIMNAFYMHKPQNFIPTDYINPLWISIHINTFVKDFMLTGHGLDYFKGFEVGARDNHTLDLLESAGVNSYLSGCLTLTLDRFDDTTVGGQGICMVDVPKDVENFVRSNTSKEVITLTNWFGQGGLRDLGWEQRFHNVEKRLKIYQSSDLVITTRLHTALPCLALGVPVVLVKKDVNDRFSTFYPLLNVTTGDKLLNGEFDFENIRSNPDGYMSYKDGLVKKVSDFISNCTNGVYDYEPKGWNVDKLLEVTSWQKNMLNNKPERRHLGIKFGGEQFYKLYDKVVFYGYSQFLRERISLDIENCIIQPDEIWEDGVVKYTKNGEQNILLKELNMNIDKNRVLVILTIWDEKEKLDVKKSLLNKGFFEVYDWRSVF